MTKSIADQLANWRAGSLRQPVTPALLGALEKSFRAKQERLLAFGGPSTARERHELNELRREFRQDWTRMRGEIAEQMDRQAAQARRSANPPPSDAVVSRMSSLAPVYLPRWQRSPGNLIQDAERFAEQGDEAGLGLAAEHAGLLEDPHHRTVFLEGVNEARSAFETDQQRQAREQAETLERQREEFELGSAMRRGTITEMSRQMGPPPNEQVPMSASARPRR